jgi:hypothetical protein
MQCKCSWQLVTMLRMSLSYPASFRRPKTWMMETIRTIDVAYQWMML